MAIDEGDFASAQAYLERALSIFEGLSGQQAKAWSSWTKGYLGLVHLLEGDNEGPMERLDASIKALSAVGDGFGPPVLLHYKGRVLRNQGRTVDARACWVEGLTTCGNLRYSWPVPYYLEYYLESFADLNLVEGRAVAAAKLAGAAAGLRERIGASLPLIWRPEFESRKSRLQEILGEELDGLWEQGRRLSLADASSLALGGSTSSA